MDCKVNGSLFNFKVIFVIFVSLIFLAVFSTKAHAGENNCFDIEMPITPEEQRIDEGAPIPQNILEDSNFQRYVDEFIEDLCSAPNLENAENKIKKNGTQLFENAVKQAQGQGADPKLDRYDDRPLYWARLHMVRALRQWTPSFSLSEDERDGLIKELEYTSRGITSVDFPNGNGVKRILVSGFDPFQLQNEFRRSNPSGASALQLDGLKVNTANGPAHIQAVILPVRWQDFDDGMVEDAFAPFLAKDAKGRLDMLMTISQGRARQMDIEEFAGRWQSGVDNEMASRLGVVPPVDHWPMPSELPEFIETTLPYEEMINANTGPWKVQLNKQICEVLPPEFTNRTCHTNGPTPGAEARSGGGGAYLSNESQYRSNRVRLGLGADDVAGGHLHIASLEFYPKDKSVYIDPAFQNHRTVTVDQTVELVKAAAHALK